MKIPRFILLSAVALSPLVIAAEKPEAATNGSNKSSEKTAEPPAKPMDKENLKKKLTPLQFEVACNAATEPPFRNAYWDNKRTGLYVDVLDGEPLFVSGTKYDSGSGWPSFYQPINKDCIVEKKDTTHGMVRIEVRSKKSDAHLGHVFPDGPKPTGLRYCINSASLKFIPVEDLEKEGYAHVKKFFIEEAPKK
jgi:methionine-R-sulfoxide reductase